jgi:predicted nucleic acid-binding protein
VLRTLDAIHLATAVRLAGADQLDALMTYDKQLAEGAREHGIAVLSPS